MHLFIIRKGNGLFFKKYQTNIIGAVAFFLPLSIPAQIQTLDTVTIQSPTLIMPFSVGFKSQKIELKNNPANLGDALSEISGIYIRDYGNQQLKTISFRGTNASHTNVLWHGIPVNAVTLGQTDFSTWSVWQISSMVVQSGAGSSLYGSGSLGGTIFIDDFNLFEKKIDETKISAAIGSFGMNFIGFSNFEIFKNWKIETNLYRNFIENDFEYEYNKTKVTQKNASVENLGLKQTFQYKKNKNRFSGDILYTINKRQIQPPLSNFDDKSNLQTQSLKSILDWVHYSQIAIFSSSISWVGNNSLYNDSIETKSQQIFFSNRIEKYFDKSFAQMGFLLKNTRAQSDNYKHQISDNDIDMYAIWTMFPFWFLNISSSLRYSIYGVGNNEFTPSLSFQYFITKNKNISFNTEFNKGFRNPTFNDRYWSPGGNIDLVAEKSFEVSQNINFIKKTENINIESKLELYKIWANDWIIWLPNTQNIWAAQNIQKVNIQGITFSTICEIQFKKGHWKQILNADYNQSINETDYLNADIEGKQLPLMPIYSWSWNNELKWMNITFQYNQNFTGKQFADIENDTKNAQQGYFLTHVSLQYKYIAFKKIENIIGLNIKNLYNLQYENLTGRAMPPRYFELNFSLKF